MTDQDQEPHGLGGWLAVFILFLGLGGVVQAAGVARYLLSLRSRVVVTFDGVDLRWLASAAAAWRGIELILCLFMAWRLIRVRNRRTLAIVIAGIWLFGLFGPIVEILVSPFSWRAPHLMRDLLRGAPLNLVICAAWTGYFLLSRRVANTYAEPPDSSGITDIFA